MTDIRTELLEFIENKLTDKEAEIILNWIQSDHILNTERRERDIDTEIKEVWKQLSDERKKISLLYLRSLLQETSEQTEK